MNNIITRQDGLHLIELEIPLDCPYWKIIDDTWTFVCGKPPHGNEPCQYTEWHLGFDHNRFPLMAAATAEWWEACSALRFEIPSGHYPNGTPECEEMRRTHECSKKAKAWRRFTLKPKEANELPKGNGLPSSQDS